VRLPNVPPLPKLPPGAAKIFAASGPYLAEALTPSLRLGVTGLSRSGKTVFITALVRNLVSGGRLPFFSAEAQGRIQSAHLEPQPDDRVPRFDYEAHLAALEADPPRWPDSTRRISELRVTITFKAEATWRTLLGPRRLHIDIVDYPGEWLIDLAMLDQDYAAWSADALRMARDPIRAAHAAEFLTYPGARIGSVEASEPIALQGAKLYTAYLKAARAKDSVSTLGPGRFLMPGDLEGSPLLTFFPIDCSQPIQAGSLAAMLERRYESYKSHVVRPFFKDHFSRLNRQIVLIDVLSELNAGPAALSELERVLANVLGAFKPGAATWLASILGRRIDKLLIAATKADHLHHTSHDRLEAILRKITDRAITRAEASGADVAVMAIAALRATREVEAKSGGEVLHCIAGVPMAGQTIDGRTFDGITEATIFPGDLPVDPADAFKAPTTDAPVLRAAFMRFRPPRLSKPDLRGATKPAPHIRLDRALNFLIGDWLE
jgi:uncharacterized protein